MRKRPQIIVTGIIAAFLLISPAYAKDAPASIKGATATATADTALPKPWLYEGSDLPPDTTWTFGELPNGLRYAVKHNEVPAGQVSIRVRVDAGSLYEHDDEQGFAHLLEHLTFRGSTHVPDGEAKRIWQRFGVTFGSDSNAETTATQTVYKLDLPNAEALQGDSTALDQSMKILSGMMREPRIVDASVNAERSIVLAELRENSGADLKLGDALREHTFQGQLFGQRSIAGSLATLQGAIAPALQAFHDRWYRPENTVIAIAGDVDPAQLEQLIKTYFSDWKGTGSRADAPDFGKPTAEGKDARVLVEPTLPMQIFFSTLRPWQKHDDTVSYNQQLLIDQLALKIINRRLEEQARAGGSYVIASVQQDNVSRSADATSVSITPVGDNWEKAIADVRAIIADATTTPPSQADIDREKTLYENALRTSLDSYPFQSAAEQTDLIVGAVDIRETTVAPQTVADVYEASKAVMTPERMFEATKRLFAGTTTRVVLAAPVAQADGEVRLADALNATIAANGNARLSDKIATFDDLPKLGAPGKLVSVQRKANPEMSILTFSNGSRALLYPNPGEAGQIRVRVRFGNGYQSKAPADGGLLWVGPNIVADNGIGDIKRTQIDQITNGRRLDLTFGTDNDAFEYAADTRPQDLADQLKLIATKMEFPGHDGAPIERMKAFATSGYNSFEMSVNAKLQRDLQYYLTNKDPRWKTPTPAEVGKVTAKSFESYWNPLLAQGPVEVLLFGDFKEADAITAIENSIGAMKPRAAAPKPAGALQLNFPAPNAQPLRLTHKGPADQAAAIIAWPTGGGIDRIVEGRHLEILAAIFRDRLFEKFRSEQAASYSPDMSSSWPEDFPQGGYLLAISQVRPEDVDSFFKFSNEVAADLATTPITADELQRAVEPTKQLIERAASGNMFWLNQLKGASYDPRKFDSLSHLYRDYSDVTPAQLQALAKQYFVPGKAWKLVVEPEAKPAK